MALESALWSWLSKARLEMADTLQMERIENLLGAGIPDVEGYVRRPGQVALDAQFWIELKSSERPARPTTPVRFKLKNRERQIEFMRKRWELGGNAFFLLQVGSGPDRALYLAPGNVGHVLQRGTNEGELVTECCKSGVWVGKQARALRPSEVIARVALCRAFPCLLPR